MSLGLLLGLLTNLSQAEVVGFAYSACELFFSLVVLATQLMSARLSRSFVVVLDVAARRSRVSEVEIVAADDLDVGQVLADRFAQLRVVGRERVGVRFDEMACGVQGRHTARRFVRRCGSGDARRHGPVQRESFATRRRAGQLHQTKQLGHLVTPVSLKNSWNTALQCSRQNGNSVDANH